MKNGSKINSWYTDEAEVWRNKIMICLQSESSEATIWLIKEKTKTVFAASRFSLITSSLVLTNRMHAGYRKKRADTEMGGKSHDVFNLIKYQNQLMHLFRNIFFTLLKREQQNWNCIKWWYAIYVLHLKPRKSLLLNEFLWYTYAIKYAGQYQLWIE